MEHETYLATSAQLLPVIALAGLLELRQLIKTLMFMGDYESPSLATRAIAHVYPRLLAACVLACLVLTGTCLEALYTGDEPCWLYPVLSRVVPLTIGLVGLPLLGAVVRPRALVSWYEEPPKAKRKKRKKKRDSGDED